MKLDELPKKNIYEAPAGYFEKLPGVMMARIREKDRVQRPFWTVLAQTYWLRSALAGLALLVGLFFVLTLNQNDNIPTENPEIILASISKQEAMDYLINSEQLQPTDLATLSQADQDISYEFIQASEEEIWQEVEFSDLHDITYN